ncbi:glycine--tRNA ligase subunit beta [Gynuella sp.]|uniref:glycine--tRNA ligase subunit beta n=1 Tax=Gynuella sp. TaxID=2969146 RepID=UPI003D0B0592
MSHTDFLIELGTEELPPKALKGLADAFVDIFTEQLASANLKHGEVHGYAAPRRLAIWIESLQQAQADETFERRGPAIQAAFDANGKPTKAAQGFAASCGVTVDQLEQLKTDKGSWLVFKGIKKGVTAETLLPDILATTVDKLPIPRRMRWGASRVEFVRPVQWLVMLLGKKVVQCELLGVSSGNTSRGHRFHAPDPLEITSPRQYADILEKQGKVIADFDRRRRIIAEQAQLVAQKQNLQVMIEDDLLDEVTALNEWPVALLGRFEERFLDVPAEALISSMAEHQKYFYTTDSQGEIQPYFVFIANLESKDSAQVIAGNEKVIRPRLSDAAFFWETDKKTPLAERITRLDTVLFQKELGSIGDKCRRLQKSTVMIAELLGSDQSLAVRAAQLAKADLVTDMVFEFTELQGIAGSYYALHDGEHEEVAAAMKEQYLPAGAGDQLPVTATGTALALADRLDNLSGLFGIGQPPSGTKDPFALRRAALGVLRILVEKDLDLDLVVLLNIALQQHSFSEDQKQSTRQQVLDYLLDRFTAWYGDQGINNVIVQAVRFNNISTPVDFDRRVKAVAHFSQNEAAEALVAANKRVSNLLSKSAEGAVSQQVDQSLLSESAEVALYEKIIGIRKVVEPLFVKGLYTEVLAELAGLRETVDAFFDQVMVMADDMAVRNNRLALLAQLRALFLEVADISVL